MSITVEVDNTKGLGIGDTLIIDNDSESTIYEILAVIDETHIKIHPYEDEVSIH